MGLRPVQSLSACERVHFTLLGLQGKEMLFLLATESTDLILAMATVYEL